MSQSLERGLQALLFLSTRKSVGVTELAEELKINKSTAYRILETMQKFNMVEQNKLTAKYKLGPAILQLSEQLYKNLNIISISKPLMISLSEEVGESVHLCILSNDCAVVIEQFMTSSRLTVNAKIGNKEPLHSSSVGKCLLAFNSDEIREQIINRLELTRFTDKTITNKQALLEELEIVKTHGYAIDNGEISEEIKCIAAPIFNHLGEAIYSLGISGPNSRMNDKKIEFMKNKLVKVTEIISQQIGYTKHTKENNNENF